jgi:hypothetical protein
MRAELRAEPRRPPLSAVTTASTATVVYLVIQCAPVAVALANKTGVITWLDRRRHAGVTHTGHVC